MPALHVSYSKTSTTQLLKLFVGICNLNLRLNNFKEWPRVAGYSDKEKTYFVDLVNFMKNLIDLNNISSNMSIFFFFHLKGKTLHR